MKSSTTELLSQEHMSYPASQSLCVQPADPADPRSVSSENSDMERMGGRSPRLAENSVAEKSSFGL